VAYQIEMPLTGAWPLACGVGSEGVGGSVIQRGTRCADAEAAISPTSRPQTSAFSILCIQMIFLARRSATSVAPKPSSPSTASLCSPSSGAMPGLAGVSENCQGVPCTFSRLPCLA
jgi:hypothetical protein